MLIAEHKLNLFFKRLESTIFGHYSLPVHLFVAIFVYIILGTAMQFYYFRGGDGVFVSAMINVNLAFNPNPLTHIAISPYEGMGDISVPMNVWLSPSLLAHYFVSDPALKVLLPFVIAGFLVFLSIFVLGRTTGFSRTESIGGAWLGSLMVTPYYVWSAKLGLYAIPYLHVITLNNIALASFAVLGRDTAKSKNIAYGFSLLTFVFFILLFSTTYGSVPGIILLFLGIGFVSGIRNLHEAKWKFAFIFVILLTLFILRFDQYLIGLTSNTGRFFFDESLFKRKISNTYISIFSGSFYGILAIIAVIGAMISTAKNRQRYFRMAVGLIVSFVFLTGLFFTQHNTSHAFPDAYQFEFFLIGVYALFVSYCIFKVLPALIGKVLQLTKLTTKLRRKTRTIIFCIFAIIVAINSRSQIYRFFFHPAPKIWKVQHTEISNFLESKLAVNIGDRWRGSVVSYIGAPNRPTVNRHEKAVGEIRSSFGNGHADHDLRYFRIPTLETDTPYLTPTYVIFVTKLLQTNQTYTLHNKIYINRFRPRLLRMMGVRFIIDEVANIGRGFKPIKSLSSENGEKTLYLFDLKEPNIGQYSPTNVTVAKNLKVSLAKMDDENFDFRRSVITSSKISDDLIPASNSQIRAEQMGFRVTASSIGKSFLVLPIQHSHCLTWTPISPNNQTVSLVQANVIQTGLLFSGSIDGHLSYKFGPFSNSKCRFKDAEYAKLK